MGTRALAPLGVFCLILLGGCNDLEAWLDAAKVTEPLDQFAEILRIEDHRSDDSASRFRSYNRRQLTELVQRIVHQAIDSARTPPRLIGKLTLDHDVTSQFLKDNGEALLDWLDSFDGPLKTLRKVLWMSSKKALEGVNDRRQSALDYGLAFFTLRAISHLANRLEIAMTPLAKALIQSRQDPKYLEPILKKLAALVGLGVVIQQDLRRVSERMQQLQTPQTLGRQIAMLAQTARDERDLRQKALAEANAQGGADRGKAVKKEVSKLSSTQQLLVQTLLYVPGQPFSFLKLMTVISNLTWGLVNSAVGLGVVFWAMIASPFTEYINFPTFTIADSGFQIWVNARGAIMPSCAFSLGVFVFGNSDTPYACDHEGGHSFQSALLGPFYLPLVGISYLIQGHDDSFMEGWANYWASWAE